MKTILTTIIAIFIASTILQAQNPFKLYKEKDKTWRASIFALYAKQYADIQISQTMIDYYDLTTIQDELSEYDNTTTTDVTKAVNAVANGQKVFFFIENAVWGGLETGIEFSGSWQINMPKCSGFYPTSDKCFQNEGLNYHCGKKLM